ncbi:MAG: hypothetical protein Phog2KO_42130 [Phototrophicaceae bacterium]
MITQSTKQTYLYVSDGIKISKYIIQVSSKRYSVSHMVSFDAKEFMPNRRELIGIGLVIGLLIGGFIGLILSNLFNFPLFLIGLGIAGAWAGAELNSRRAKSTYGIQFTFSSGEVALYVSSHKKEISQLTELSTKLIQYSQSK